jgi:hypothetical protein
MSENKTYSTFMTQVHGADGKLKHHSMRRNLTTDAAVGFTNRRDWQSKSLGGGAFLANTWNTGTATATNGTSLTNTSATFYTTGQGLAGAIVAAGPRATSSAGDSTVFGVIVSNSSTVLTIDQWYSSATMALGTTPNAACSYQIIPGQMPAIFLAVTANTFTPSNTDTTLAGELTSNGFTRVIGTYSHTAAATTYVLSTVFTATGTETINNEAVFGAANTTAGGVMPFESAEPSPPTLVSTDTLTQTVTITIN